LRFWVLLFLMVVVVVGDGDWWCIYVGGWSIGGYANVCNRLCKDLLILSI
jgi:hypothetical protein